MFPYSDKRPSTGTCAAAGIMMALVAQSLGAGFATCMLVGVLTALAIGLLLMMIYRLWRIK
jgi:hypothetical protein